MVESLPYGSWPSPIGADLLVAGESAPLEVVARAGTTWWASPLPDQGGRIQITRRGPEGTTRQVLPEGFSARSRVHEYGGGAWWVAGDTVFFVNGDDQRLYRLDPGTAPIAISEAPETSAALRYADGRLTPDGGHVVCVRERHLEGDVRNEIVALPAAGGPAVVLVGDSDFVAAPRISPDGSRLVWLSWNHPDMPWDSTALWVAELVPDGHGGLAVAGAERWAHGPQESLVQPEWGPDGTLFVISDRADWWNVYRVPEPGRLVPVHPVAADIARPAWQFDRSVYQVADDGTVWFSYATTTGARLVRVPDPAGNDGPAAEYPVEALGLESLRVDGDRVVAIALSAERERSLGQWRVVDGVPGPVTDLVAARDLALPAGTVSRSRPISVPSARGRTAHARFFPPSGAGVRGPDGELPPLLLQVHGGPTSSADPSFRLAVQFWTSRGFAVVDVDYGGSSGYGRRYRRLLDGAWGVVDVEDACAVAQWLVDQQWVDGDRLVIRGRSAGGFTTLAALATTDVFAAGASHYGVTELAALARGTHKFEARYLDRLVGPWPQAEAVYRERSPLSHLDGFDVPLIVFQGLADEVVPPSQSELIVEGLRARRIPHAYLAFPGEQHGFRIAANIVRAVTAELSFYSQVFGFALADAIEPVTVAFASGLRAGGER